MLSQFSALVLSALVVVSGDDSETKRPTADEIERAVQQLGDPQFGIRTSATEFLWKAGHAAELAVTRAVDSSDPEVSYRARTILDKFKYGIFPDTPPESLKLITQFRDGDVNKKRSALSQLQQKGEVRLVLTLLKTDLPENLRKEFRSRYLRDVERLVPTLLVDGDIAQAELLLELAAGTDAGMRHFAVYHLLRGTIDEKIAELKGRRPDSLNATDARLLMYLLRAKGDLDGAEPARIAGSLNEIHYERGDWQQLAKAHPVVLPKPLPQPKLKPKGPLDRLFEKEGDKKRPDPFGGKPEDKKADPAAPAAAASLSLGTIEKLGYAAAYQRLAGNTQEFNKAVEILKSVGMHKPSDAWLRFDAIWHSSEALLVNRRFDDAIEILGKARPQMAFELLCEQHRYRDAFKLAGIDDPTALLDDWFAETIKQEGEQGKTRFQLGIEVARVLGRVGRADEAKRHLKQMADSVKDDNDVNQLTAICSAEYKLGFREQAFDHASIILDKQGKPYVLRNFFKTSAPHVQALWPFFHGRPFNLKPRVATVQLHDLFRPKRSEILSSDELQILVDPISDLVKKEEDQTKRGTVLLALGELCLRQRDEQLAVRMLEQAAEASSVAAMLRLGDLAAKREDWAKAAEWYHQTWQQNAKDPRNTVGLYLSGRALTKADQAKKGRRQMELARLLPLAGSNRRSLADALRERGLKEEARAEYELIMRTATFQSWEFHNAAQHFGNLVAPTDRVLAADCWEKLFLSVLQTSSAFVETEGYLKLPHVIHKSRARGLLTKGEKNSAAKELWLSFAARPADVKLAEDVVPELRQAEFPDLADELFNKVYERIDSVCKDFPNSALHHNNLAWLAARCDRRLDDALRSAEIAVKLTPDNAGYIDTLAEVHFRRGDHDKAIQFCRKCLELQPDNDHFQKQLKRFTKSNQE